MDIKTCRNCGRIFQSRGAYICPDCMHEIDAKFVKVRNYMYENPKASIEEICEENDVTAEMVMSWLREGRLIVADNAVPLINCSSCGKPIVSGRLCVECTSGLNTRVSSTSRDMAKELQLQKEAAEKRGYHTDYH